MNRLKKTSFAKHAEFTFGVHESVIQEVLGGPIVCMVNLDHDHVVKHLEEMDKGVVGAVRSLYANHPIGRQLIVYALTYKFDPQNKLLFGVYKRNKKNVGDHEARLALNVSLGAGGHAEMQDVILYLKEQQPSVQTTETAVDMSSVVDLCATAEFSLYREYPEEVDVISKGNSFQPLAEADVEFTGFVMDTVPDNKNYVGNIHFGIIGLVELPGDAVFEMNEENNDAIGWVTASELQMYSRGEKNCGLAEHPGVEGVPFEPWSKLIIDEIHQLERKLVNRRNK